MRLEQRTALVSGRRVGHRGRVIASTRAMAREAARYHVRVNAVAPGPIDTPLLDSRPTTRPS